MEIEFYRIGSNGRKKYHKATLTEALLKKFKSNKEAVQYVLDNKLYE